MSPAGHPCSRFDRSRSELVDGSIGPEARDILVRHLTECRGCREDVAELRRLRQLLHARRPDGTAPSAGLQGKLVSIAADGADEPLWTDAFRPWERPTGRMPSRRRRRRRLAATLTLFGSVVVAAAGVGYAVAPGEARAVADPTESARSGFATVRTTVPLTSDPATAAMVAAGRLPTGSAAETSLWAATGTGTGAGTGVGTGAGTGAAVFGPQLPTAGRPIGASAASAVLTRGERAAGTVGYTGVEQVVVRDGGRQMTAEVAVTVDPAQTTDVTVRADSGATIASGSLPATVDRGPGLAVLLAGGYRLTGTAGVAVLGRRATVVQAEPTDPTSGRPTARWWFDQQTGLLLGRQTFDPFGALLQSSMLTSLTVDSTPLPQSAVPQLTAPVAATVLAPSASSGLSAAGWECEQTLAGLALTQVLADDPSRPGLVHLVYTDGVTTLTVVERRGRLTAAPAGSVRDSTLDAFVSGGTPLTASWQSGDRVITVVTDGSRAQLAQAVHSLPHETLRAPTTMGRVREGWSRIVSLVFR